jgi:glutathione S-transferase
MATVNELVKAFEGKLDAYETILSKQDYMVGNDFSLVDIFYMPFANKLFGVGKGNLITDRPHVKAWWERITARESWKQVKALHEPVTN